MCTLSGPDGTIAEVVVRSKRVKCRLNKFIILNSSMHRILWWPICCKLIYNKQIFGAIHLPCPSWAMGFGCLRAVEKVPNFLFFWGGMGGKGKIISPTKMMALPTNSMKQLQLVRAPLEGPAGAKPERELLESNGRPLPPDPKEQEPEALPGAGSPIPWTKSI